MKKIVFLSLFALWLPWVLSAQSVDDDLYYVPSKKKEETKRTRRESVVKDEIVVRSNAPTKVYTSPGRTTVVVKGHKGKARDIDEYNRRYSSGDYDFSQENGTLYINEKEDDGLNGEWMNGEFEGSRDDYEYATRIIRFRNPRYAISISSPLYWDVAYGLNSWDWNVYTDGMYAYAFPTFSNRLWWNWRYNSYGWGGYPYYGWGWSSRYGPGWDIGWGGWYGYHPYYFGAWYPGGDYWGGGYREGGSVYTHRRSSGPSYSTRNVGGTARRSSSVVNDGQAIRRSVAQDSQRSTGQFRRSAADAARRVVSTRPSYSTVRSGMSNRMDGSSIRRSAYTRPSSTRRSAFDGNAYGARRSVGSNRSTYMGTSSRRSSSTYNRGSSNMRNYYNHDNMRRSYNNSTRSSSNFSSGSSSRSSSGSYSSGGGRIRRSSSGGGGTSRRR